MKIKEKIENYKEEIIKNLDKLISYRSVLGEAEESAPFGIECAKCLNEALEISKGYGFKTKNLDGYCGYAEIGKGNEIIGIVTHLDVVPEGNEWETNPYKISIKNNKIYGRGASDDKGAVVASMMALKLLKDMDVPLNKRIRLIMGCNEESGSKCMEYYVKKEGNIDIGFTPDGDFPVVNGEKGQIKLEFKTNNTKNLYIKGGVVTNAVSDNCIVRIKKELYNREILEKYFENSNLIFNIDQRENYDEIMLKGLSAHASTPELGINAISYMIMGLQEAGYEDELIRFYSKYIKLEVNGKSFGIKNSDKYGELTFVNSMIDTIDEKIIGTVDIRVPILVDSCELANKIEKVEYQNASIKIKNVVKSLYYDEETPLVRSLLNAYKIVTGYEEAKPFTIGGGTYAKSMNNCVAFGCKFPNTDNRIHNSNEFVDIDELLLQVEMYVYAIIQLLEV